MGRSCLPCQRATTAGPGPKRRVWFGCAANALASTAHPLGTERSPRGPWSSGLCAFYICQRSHSLLPQQVCVTRSFSSAALPFGGWRIGRSSGQGSLAWAGPLAATVSGLGRTKRHPQISDKGFSRIVQVYDDTEGSDSCPPQVHLATKAHL